MFWQLLLGSVLMIVTVAAAAVIWLGVELVLARLHRWAGRPPHAVKLVAILMIALMATILMVTVATWVWAGAFLALGLFGSAEPAVYFAIVAFTTLGFGDVLLPDDWQLLGGMAAANGLILFGLVTAVLVETLRATRLRQQGRFGS